MDLTQYQEQIQSLIATVKQAVDRITGEFGSRQQEKQPSPHAAKNCD